MARILVVDDDRSIADLIEMLLTRKGHEVHVARNGKQGLVMAQEKKPELIVLDVMMPEMDGFTVSGTLFKDPALRTTPILVLTAQTNTRDIFELVPNVRQHMRKPFDPQDFVQTVEKILAAERKAA